MPDTAAARITAALDAALTAAATTPADHTDRTHRTDRAAVWHLAELIAADWSARPLSPEDGYPEPDLEAAAQELGHPLPAALREALRLFGRRDDLTRNQDPLTTLEDLTVHEGALIFRDENQGACFWGVLLEDLGQDDPPTYFRADMADKNKEEWIPWTEKLSLALVEALMAETVLADTDDDLGDSHEIGDEALEQTGLTPLPRIQPAWYQTTWYIGDDILAHATDGAWITIRARTSKALNAYNGDNADED